MNTILKLKINVSKINKEKLFHGEKGVYLDATVLLNKDGEDRYGNHGMIVEDVTYDERQEGIKGPILGNAKWAGESKPKQSSAPDPGQAYRDKAGQNQTVLEGDDIPF